MDYSFFLEESKEVYLEYINVIFFDERALLPIFNVLISMVYPILFDKSALRGDTDTKRNSGQVGSSVPNKRHLSQMPTKTFSGLLSTFSGDKLEERLAPANISTQVRALKIR
jgi:hypothetical protein